MVHQLLQDSVLEDGDVLAASLAMTGTLADTAAGLLQANCPVGHSSSSGSSSNGATTVRIPGASAGHSVGRSSSKVSPGGDGGAAAAAVLLLEFAAHLLHYTKQQAAALEQPPPQQQQQAGGSADQASLTQQVSDIQQQVSICDYEVGEGKHMGRCNVILMKVLDGLSAYTGAGVQTLYGSWGVKPRFERAQRVGVDVLLSEPIRQGGSCVLQVAGTNSYNTLTNVTKLTTSMRVGACYVCTSDEQMSTGQGPQCRDWHSA